MVNPLDWETIRHIEFDTGLKIKIAVSSEKTILDAIEHFYATDKENWDILKQPLNRKPLHGFIRG